MLINNKKDENSHVKFISYNGKYPCLCNGTLILEIDGKQEVFIGDRIFWHSGGICRFSDAYYSKSYIDKDEWIIDANKIPEQYRKYAEEIDKVFNENVEHGCCGGCL